MKNSRTLFAMAILLCFILFCSFTAKGEIGDLLSKQPSKEDSAEDFLVPGKGLLKFPADPFFEGFERKMHDAFKSFSGLHGMKFPNFTREMHGYSQGKSDVKIDGDNVVVIMDLPGHSKDSIDLRISNRKLIVSSERKSEQQEEEENRFFRKEISYGNFSRIISLPREIIEEKSIAEFRDGVLRVILPINKNVAVDEKGYKIEIR